jgi:hypothetical protein
VNCGGKKIISVGDNNNELKKKIDRLDEKISSHNNDERFKEKYIFKKSVILY